MNSEEQPFSSAPIITHKGKKWIPLSVYNQLLECKTMVGELEYILESRRRDLATDIFKTVLQKASNNPDNLADTGLIRAIVKASVKLADMLSEELEK